jgi:hypothetical protein
MDRLTNIYREMGTSDSKSCLQSCAGNDGCLNAGLCLAAKRFDLLLRESVELVDTAHRNGTLEELQSG